MLTALLSSLAVGLLISLVTGVLLTVKKAVRLPGGSLAAGMMIGFGFITDKAVAYNHVLVVVLCALAGIVGWIIYVLLFRKIA